MAIKILEKCSLNKNWNVQITASDINNEVLHGAQLGVYRPYALSKTSKYYKRKYFRKCDEDNHYVLKKRVRKMVKFNHHNLLNSYIDQKFDVIFCRNVMIYFDEESKIVALSNIYESLLQGGYLILGYAETLLGSYVPLKYIKPAVYQKA